MKTLIKYYILIFCLFADFVMFADPGADIEGGGIEDNDPPPAPINGKLLFLAIAGVLFILYTYKKNKQQKV
jgi:hypothetical protein